MLKYLVAYPFGLVAAYFIMMILALPILVVVSLINRATREALPDDPYQDDPADPDTPEDVPDKE